jgi:hypothetical protein
MRALVVFYFLTGTTRRVAQAVAAERGADVEEIRCPIYRRGFFGFWPDGYASWSSEIPETLSPSMLHQITTLWWWRACLGMERMHADPRLSDA